MSATSTKTENTVPTTIIKIDNTVQYDRHMYPDAVVRLFEYVLDVLLSLQLFNLV